MVTILAVRADWVGAKLVTETHAGIRRGCICHSKAKAVGAAGGPGSERFDHPCWTFTSALVYPPVTHA